MRALREAGLKRFWRFAWYAVADVVYRVLTLPPLQAWFLRRLGARIGADTVMIDTRFMSVNINGFRHLEIGRECFLGNEVMIDLASPIAIEDRVSIAARCVILSHLNVGYRDHPLQPLFPRRFEGVRIREGSFIGASVTILPGVEIGPLAFVAAGSVVSESVPPRVFAAGVPARVVRRLDETPVAREDAREP